MEGDAAAAGLAGAPAGARRAVSAGLSLARLGRGWRAAVRDGGRRSAGAAGGNAAGARGRVVAAARVGRQLGSDLGRAGGAGVGAASGQLRSPARMVAPVPRALRRPAAQAHRGELRGRERARRGGADLGRDRGRAGLCAVARAPRCDRAGRHGDAATGPAAGFGRSGAPAPDGRQRDLARQRVAAGGAVAGGCRAVARGRGRAEARGTAGDRHAPARAQHLHRRRHCARSAGRRLDAAGRCRACSPRARCWTGRRRLAATCSRLASARARRRRRGWWAGSGRLRPTVRRGLGPCPSRGSAP